MQPIGGGCRAREYTLHCRNFDFKQALIIWLSYSISWPHILIIYAEIHCKLSWSNTFQQSRTSSMFDVTYCNAPQDEPLRGFEKCFHHGDTLEMQQFLCALVYIPPKHSIAKQAFFHWKEVYKSSIGLLSKPKFTIVVQSSYKVGEMVCSRISIQHVWAQNSLKLRSSIVQSMDFKDWVSDISDIAKLCESQHIKNW